MSYFNRSEQSLVSQNSSLPFDHPQIAGLGIDTHSNLEALAWSGRQNQSNVGNKSENGPIRVIFVGRFGAQKGSDILAQVAKRVDKDLVHFDVLGDGKADDDDLALLKSLPNVTYHGWVERTESHRLMDMADLLFMPSRWEGLPLTTLEAMRAKAALLTSDIDVLSDINAQFGCGITCATVEDYVAALTLIERPEWKAMGERARTAFVDNYQFEDMANAIDQMIGLV